MNSPLKSLPQRRLVLSSWAFVLVAMSGLLHAVWNLFAKRSAHPVVFLWLFQCVAVLAFLPWALCALASHPISGRGWLMLAAAVTMHGIYVIFLSRTYDAGDLSQVYPMMRGVSPLLVPILAVAVLGEAVSGLGWAGIGAIVAGILLLGDWHWRTSDGQRAGVPRAARLALTVGLAITGYTLLDKVALPYVAAVTLNDAGNLANVLALSWWALRSGVVRKEWARTRQTIILAGILAPGSYLLFLLALREAAAAQVAPMRAVGTVFGTVLGVVVLGESHGRRRIAAAGLIAAGVVALGLWG